MTDELCDDFFGRYVYFRKDLQSFLNLFSRANSFSRNQFARYSFGTRGAFLETFFRHRYVPLIHMTLRRNDISLPSSYILTRHNRQCLTTTFEKREKKSVISVAVSGSRSAAIPDNAYKLDLRKT